MRIPAIDADGHVQAPAGAALAPPGTYMLFIVNDKGTTGTGLLTGTQYRQIGATRENDLVVEDAPVVVSFANILNLVGQGQAPNLLIHETFHLTINANGVTTVEREIERIECR